MTDEFDQLVEWEFEFFTGEFMDLLGPVFPAAVAIWLMGVLYIYTRSMAMPTVISILLGGSMIAYMPAEAQNVGILLVFAGIASSIWMFFGGRRQRL